MITPTAAAPNNGSLYRNSSMTTSRSTGPTYTGAGFITDATKTAPGAAPTAAIIGGGSVAVLLGAVAAIVMV
jgi:hypothetical protein